MYYEHIASEEEERKTVVFHFPCSIFHVFHLSSLYSLFSGYAESADADRHNARGHNKRKFDGSTTATATQTGRYCRCECSKEIVDTIAGKARRPVDAAAHSRLAQRGG